MAGFRGSGLSVREYCLRHRLAESAFHFWRRELQRRDDELQSPAFVPVTVVPASTIEVRCPSGDIITLPDTNVETLRHIFAALAPEASC
jgi:transposase-like protein